MLRIRFDLIYLNCVWQKFNNLKFFLLQEEHSLSMDVHFPIVSVKYHHTKIPSHKCCSRIHCLNVSVFFRELKLLSFKKIWSNFLFLWGSTFNVYRFDINLSFLYSLIIIKLEKCQKNNKLNHGFMSCQNFLLIHFDLFHINP